VADAFAHLHVHTEYPMLDGASRLDEVIAAAAADGQPALGITDHGNMYGVLDFYRGCRDAGIKPIIGTHQKCAGQATLSRIRAQVVYTFTVRPVSCNDTVSMLRNRELELNASVVRSTSHGNPSSSSRSPSRTAPIFKKIWTWCQ